MKKIKTHVNSGFLTVFNYFGHNKYKSKRFFEKTQKFAILGGTIAIYRIFDLPLYTNCSNSEQTQYFFNRFFGNDL